jgi:uncharacterized protein with NRDE domain
MCLVVLAFNQDSEYPLIFLGNRDEFHARPTRNADWWADRPDIIGGRDLQAGGTWLALHRNGRFATVTNFRDAQLESRDKSRRRSRGHLVTDFLQSELAPADYLQQVDGSAYAGFNLLVADRQSVAYLSNRAGDVQELPAGIYGLSNATLDTPWDKVLRSKAAVAALLEQGRMNETELLRILDDRRKSPVDEVSSDGLSFSTAHALTAPFITLPDYGTRCSTVVLAKHSGEIRFLERRFDADGVVTGESRFSFQSTGA